MITAQAFLTEVVNSALIFVCSFFARKSTKIINMLMQNVGGGFFWVFGCPHDLHFICWGVPDCGFFE